MDHKVLEQIASRLVKTEMPFSVVDSVDDFKESSKELYEQALVNDQDINELVQAHHQTRSE